MIRRSLGSWTGGGGIEVAAGAYSSIVSAELVGLSCGARGVVLRTTVKLNAVSETTQKPVKGALGNRKSKEY